VAERTVSWKALADFSQARREADRTADALRRIRREQELLNAAGAAGGLPKFDISMLSTYVKQLQVATDATNTFKAAQQAESAAMDDMAKASDAANVALGPLVGSMGAARDAARGAAVATKDAASAAGDGATKVKQLGNASRDAGRATRDLEQHTSRLPGVFGLISRAVIRISDGFQQYKKDAGALWSAIGQGALVLGKFGGIAALAGSAIDVLAAGVVQLAGGFAGLVGEIAPALGVIGAIPGIVVAAAGGIGTLLAGFSGVGGAFKAYQSQQEKVVKGNAAAASSAKQVQTAEDALSAARTKAARSVVDDAAAVKAAEEGVSAARTKAARTAVDDAIAVKDARRSVSQAESQGANQIAAAEQSVAQAQGQARIAQQQINIARKEARDTIAALRKELQGQKLDEEGASLSLREAQLNLQKVMNDPASTKLQRDQAEYQVDVAKNNVTNVKDQTKKVSQQYATAAKAGVEGSKQVVDAKQNEKQAEQAVSDAQKSLAQARVQAAEQIRQANEALSKALSTSKRDAVDSAQAIQQANEGLSKALINSKRDAADNAKAIRDAVKALAAAKTGTTTAATATNQYADAMKNLTPEARAVVRQLIRMQKLTGELQKTAQRGMLPGFLNLLKAIARLFPQVNGFVGTASGKFGHFFDRVAKAIGGKAFKRDFPEVLDTSTKLIGYFLDGAFRIGKVLGRIVVAAQPLTKWLFRMADGWTKSWDSMTKGRKGAERLSAFFDHVKDVLKPLGKILGNTFGGLFNVFKIAGDAVSGKNGKGGLLGSLVEVSKTFLDFTKSAKGKKEIAEWAQSGAKLLRALGKLFLALLGFIGKIGKDTDFAKFVDSIRTDLLPHIEKFLEDLKPGGNLEKFVGILGKLFDVMDHLVNKLGGGGQLLDVFGKFLDGIDWLITNTPKKVLEDIVKVLAGAAIAGFLLKITGIWSIFKKITGLAGGVKKAVDNFGKLFGFNNKKTPECPPECDPNCGGETDPRHKGKPTRKERRAARKAARKGGGAGEEVAGDAAGAVGGGGGGERRRSGREARRLARRAGEDIEGSGAAPKRARGGRIRQFVRGIGRRVGGAEGFASDTGAIRLGGRAAAKEGGEAAEKAGGKALLKSGEKGIGKALLRSGEKAGVKAIPKLVASAAPLLIEGGPVGWIIAAAILLAIAVVLVITHWKQIKKAFGEAWGWIKKRGIEFGGWFMKHWHAVWDPTWKVVKRVWGVIHKTLTTMWHVIKFILGVIWGVIKFFAELWYAVFIRPWVKVAKWLYPYLVKLWHWFRDIFDKVWNTIKTVWNKVTDWLSKTITRILNWVKKQWLKFKTHIVAPIEAALVPVQKAVRKIWDVITKKIQDVLDWLKKHLAPVWNIISKPFKDAWDALRPILGKIWGGVKNAMQKIHDWMSKLTGWAKDIWSGFVRAISNPIAFIYNNILQPFFRGANVILKAVGMSPIVWPKWTPMEFRGKASSGSTPRIGGPTGITVTAAEGGEIPGTHSAKRDNVLGVDSHGRPTARVESGEYVLPRWMKPIFPVVDRMRRRRKPIHGTDVDIDGLREGGITRPINANITRGLHDIGAMGPDSSAVDVSAHTGTKVVSGASGVVSTSKDLRGSDGRRSVGGYHSYGRYIQVAHNGFNTLYAHLSQRQASQGQRVQEGQQIGLSGETGHTYGAHLHFGAQHKNPQNFFSVPWGGNVIPAPGGNVGGGGGGLFGGLAGKLLAKVLRHGTEVANVASLLSPLGLALRLVGKFIGWDGFAKKLSGGLGRFAKGGLGQAIGKFPGKVANGFLDWVAKTFLGSSSSDPGGSGVDRWKPTVIKALGMAGLPTGSNWVNAWLSQIGTESGGNPGITQGVNDRNSGGNEAVGLVQLIPGTFAAYRNKSLPNDRTDPLANLVAGMNWEKHKKGGNLAAILADIGHGHGYAGGTSGASPGWHWVGERGPELKWFRGGEPVVNNRDAMSAVPGYDRGGVVRGFRPGASASWVQALRSQLFMGESKHWGADLTRRLKASDGRVYQYKTPANEAKVGAKVADRLVRLAKSHPKGKWDNWEWIARLMSYDPSRLWRHWAQIIKAVNKDKHVPKKIKTAIKTAEAAFWRHRSGWVKALGKELGMPGIQRTGGWNSTITAPLRHIVAHGFGWRVGTHGHGKWSPRPWKAWTKSEIARKTAEDAVAAQKRTNRLNKEWDDKLNILTKWGYSYAVRKLTDTGTADGMTLLRALVRNKDQAKKYNANVKVELDREDAKSGNLGSRDVQVIALLNAVRAGSANSMGLSTLAGKVGLSIDTVANLLKYINVNHKWADIPAPKRTRLMREARQFGSLFTFATAGNRKLTPSFLAGGGTVPGYGNGDTQPALLTPGELVVRKAARSALVRDFGPGMPAMLNNYDRLANGGFAATSMRGMNMPHLASARAVRGGDVVQNKNVTYNFNTQVHNPIAEPSGLSVQKRVTAIARLGILTRDD
jgi:murein DD-endopeptidase MepM/ murein hydrolase activator NlpD